MSRFKQWMCGVLALVNAAYPVMASAVPYIYKHQIPSLVVNTGGVLGSVNVDKANTTSTQVAAGGAVLRLAPSDINFGTLPTGELSAVQTVTLYNLGGAALTLGALSATSQFSVTDNCDGVLLGPLASCQVNVKFTPTQMSADLVAGKVTAPFSSNGESANAYINVFGQAQEPLAGKAQTGGLEGFDGTTGTDGTSLTMGTDNLPLMTFPVAIINQQSYQQSFPVISAGDTPLQYNGLAFLGNDGSFAAASDCPASIPVGQRCNVTVTFAPKTIGDKTAALQVLTGSYTGNILQVNLAGEAVEVFPVYDVASTQTVEFGAQIQGASTATRVATISNKGTAPMNVSASLQGASTAGLTVVSNTCTTPIAPNASCAVTLALSTSALTTLSAKLVVAHDGRTSPTSPVEIPVTGGVVAQTRQLQYSPTLDWGALDAGVTTPKALTVTNVGNSAVSGITASTSTPFSVATNGCAATLAPGASCDITFNATSSTNGLVSRAANIVAASLTTPATAVTLQATVQTRTISASASSLAFGLQSAGTWSADTKSVTVTNTGSVTLKPQVANRVAVTNVISTAPWLRVSGDTCSTGIAPGATCQFQFQVNPASSTSMSTSVSIQADEGFSTGAKSVTVTATGTTQNFSVSVSQLDMGAVGSLTSVDRLVTVTNTSPAGTAVTGFSGVSIANPTGGTGTLSLVNNTCVSTLASQATCSFTVRMTGASYASAAPVAFAGSSVTFNYSGARTTATTLPVTGTLVGSELSVAWPAMDFGDVPVGVAVADAPKRTVVLTNNGPYAVTYSATTRTGTLTSAVDTSVANGCSGTLAPGASCNVTIYPAPTDTDTAGAKTSSVALKVLSQGAATAAGTNTFTANFLPVSVGTSVSSIDFGVVGERTSAQKTFTFTPTHGGSFKFVGFSSSGVFSAGASCSSGTSVLKGASCTATVTATPGAYNASTPNLTGYVDVYGYDGAANVKLARVNLSVQVEKASFDVSLNDLAWGDVPTQTPGYTRYAVVTNNSASAAFPFSSRTVDSAFTLNTSNGTYTHNGSTLSNCAYISQLNAGASCYLQVSLSGNQSLPQTAGAFTGNVVLTSTASTVITVPMSANFLQPDVQHAAAVVFPTATASTQSHQPDQVLTVANQGGGRMYWVTGTTFVTTGNFYVVNKTGGATQSIGVNTSAGSTRCEETAWLDPGASCQLTLRFTPTGAAGNKTGTLTMRTYAPTLAVRTVNLSGVAKAGTATVSATSLAFGSQLVASTTTKSFTIGNAGDGPMDLRNLARTRASGAASAYPDEFTAAHNCPATLQPGESCDVSVTFTPDRNLDWGLLSDKEAFRFQHFTDGNWTQVIVPFTGTSYGSKLSVDQHTVSLGNIEKTSGLDQSVTKTLTYTASGEAPVRILNLGSTNLGYVERYSGGTCVAGLTLQPGESCTVVVRSLSDYSNRNLGNVSTYGQVMDINGTYYGTGTTAMTDRYTTVGQTGTVVAPLGAGSITPTYVTNQIAVPATAYGSSMRAGVQTWVDTTPVENTFVSATELKLTVPAGLTVGAHTLKVRNNDGVTKEISFTFNVVDHDVRPDSANDVYTAAPLYDETTGRAVPLPDGRVLVADSSANVTLYDANYNKLATYNSRDDSRTPANVRLLVNGSTGTLVWQTYENSTICTSWGATWCFGYRASGYLTLFVEQFTIGASSLTAGAVTSAVLAQGSTSSGNPIATNPHAVTLYGMDAARTNGTVLAAYSFSTPTMGTVSAAQAVTTAGAWGSAYALPASTASMATALSDTAAYVRQGDTVYTFDLSGTALSSLTAYQYAGSLAGVASNGMTFNAATSELMLPCYADAVVCTIPAYGSALGVVSPLAGDSSAPGYTDGSYAQARLKIASAGAGPSGGLLVRQSTRPQAVRVVNR